MKTFITGGSGFIGAHLIRQLRKKGHQVGALWRRSGQAPEGSHTIRGDLLQVQQWEHHLGGVEVIIHCAAAMDPISDAEEGDQVNRVATLELARAARRQGVERFIFISSIAAIGIRDLPGGVGPDTPCRPTTLYGQTKRRAELELISLGEGGPRVTIIRPPTVYGPGESRNFLSLVKAIGSRQFLVPGSGDNPMSFCHVQNLVEAVEFVMTRECPPILHVTDLPHPTLRQVCEAIAAELDVELLPLPFPLGLARLTAMAVEVASALVGRPPPLSRGRLNTLTSRYALDCTHLLHLGYRPPVNFREGIGKTVKWYRDHIMK